MAQVRHKIRNEIELPVRIDQGKDCAGQRHERHVFGRPFGKILHNIRQELELIDQVRIFRSIDLGKLHFQEGEFLMNAF